MPTTTECLDTLLRLVARSDRNELAEAQAAIIQLALAAPDPAARQAAMAELQTAFETELRGIALEPVQSAYGAVVASMIDRTRDAVLDPGGSTPAGPDRRGSQ